MVRFFLILSASLLAMPLRVAANPTKNVILIVGDGMGFQAIGLLESYSTKTLHRPSHLSSLFGSGEVGVVSVEPASYLVNDSACSATQLASGSSCHPQTLGLDEQGGIVSSIAEEAKRCGKQVGLVTDTRVTHATPAAFYAHLTDRDNENMIAEQFFESRVDLLFGGGLRHFVGAPGTWDGLASVSKRKDGLDLLSRARQKQISLVFSRSGLLNATQTPILGLFAPSGLADGISRRTERSPKSEPSLGELATNALRLLDKNQQGFFLMVEAGQIDWAEHANDAGWLLAEMLQFDELLGVILEWKKTHDDTLVVVTADHSTGGFGFSYSAFNVPKPRLLQQGLRYAPDRNFVNPDVLRRIALQKRTFHEVHDAFRTLPVRQQSPEKLQDLVNGASDFLITLEQAARILRTHSFRFYEEGDEELGFKTSAEIEDVDAFYPELAKYGFGPIIARVVAEQQGVVWSTGTHTSEPVPVYAYGPNQETYRGSYGMRLLGHRIRDDLLGKCEARAGKLPVD